jgi:hypothetical protein
LDIPRLGETASQFAIDLGGYENALMSLSLGRQRAKESLGKDKFSGRQEQGPLYYLERAKKSNIDNVGDKPY